VGLSGSVVILASDSFHLGDQEFTVVAEQPIASALALARDSLRTMAAATTGALILAVVLVVLTINRVVGPIEALAVSATAIASGDFAQQLDVPGQDEITELAEAFNRMSSQLGQLVAGLEKEIAERKRTEEALHESEERFRSIVEQSSDGIVLTDEQGAIIEWNHGQEWITGLKRDEAVGRPLWDVQFQVSVEERKTPALLEQNKAGMLEFLKTGQAPWLGRAYDHVIVRPDGTPRHVQAVVFPIKTDKGFMSGSISRDVTDSKRAEEALRESESRYRAVVDTQTELIDRWLPDGTLTFVNEAYARYYGKSREEIIGQDWMTVVHEKDHEEVAAYRQHLLASLTPDNPVETDEHRETRADGSIRWQHWTDRGLFDEHGRLVEIQSTGRDITRRRQAEEELRRHRDHLEDLVAERTADLAEERDRAQRYLDIAGVIMVALDEKGRIKLINREGCTLLGHEEAKLIGQNWFDKCLPPASRVDVWDSFMKLIAGDIEAVEYYENPVLTKAGEERLIAWHNTLLRDEAGAIIGTLSSGEDITERKQAEEALKAAYDRLQDLDRMKNAFIAGISHEVRTPISNLKLRHHLLAGFVDTDKAGEHLDVLERETNRLHGIIEDVLYLSNLDQEEVALDLAPVDLNRLANRFVRDRRSLAEERGLNLSFRPQTDLPTILGDAVLLERVLGILVSNAFSYTPDGGKIEVRTHARQSDGKQWAGISVVDDGPGIPADEQPRLFERFFRGRASLQTGTPGSGLGLATASEIARRHAGEIEFADEGIEGTGSTFTLRMPVLD
jgi:PAS domain S-box-containing protein